uniref:Uncharacterized protein n=2 Tax=Streptomyces sp. NBC_00148 TaxID=2903626 RepID=A0AAU1M4Z3_9ACTN
MSMTREQLTALFATVLGLLVCAITLHVGGGWADSIAAAFLTYVATVIGLAVKMRISLVAIVTATGRGSIIAGVVVVLLLSSVARSLATVMS